MKTYLSTLLQIRLLVGYLGEKNQFSWWPTTFYGDYSVRSIEFITLKSFQLTQYHGVLEAARKLHDEHLNVGCYHLFRFPEEIEQGLHALMQNESTEISWKLPQDKDLAMMALKELSDTTLSNDIGPKMIGGIDLIYADDTPNIIAISYFSAFSQNFKTYPYFVS